MNFVDQALLNQVLTAFDHAIDGWMLTLHPMALGLFYLLGAIELSWSGIRLMMDSRSEGLYPFFELFLRKLIYFAFLRWLLSSAPVALGIVIAGFQRAGATAAGVPTLRPNDFLATGVRIAVDYLQQLDLLGLLVDPLGQLQAIIGMFVIILSFAAMAATLVITLVESRLAVGAVYFLLAFAACRWTAPMAQAAVAHVFRIGVKLFVVYLIAAVVSGLTTQWADQVNSALFTGPISYTAFLMTVVVLALLVWLIPSHAARMVPPSLNLGLSPSVGDN